MLTKRSRLTQNSLKIRDIRNEKIIFIKDFSNYSMVRLGYYILMFCSLYPLKKSEPTIASWIIIAVYTRRQ